MHATSSAANIVGSREIDEILNLYLFLHTFSAKREGASTGKLQVKAAKFVPLQNFARSRKTQSTVGMVLSIYTTSRPAGDYKIAC